MRQSATMLVVCSNVTVSVKKFTCVSVPLQWSLEQLYKRHINIVIIIIIIIIIITHVSVLQHLLTSTLLVHHTQLASSNGCDAAVFVFQVKSIKSSKNTLFIPHGAIQLNLRLIPFFFNKSKSIPKTL